MQLMLHYNSSTTVKICRDNRSRSKRSKRTNRHHEKQQIYMRESKCTFFRSGYYI